MELLRQPVATGRNGFGSILRFARLTDLPLMRPVATTGLHKGSILVACVNLSAPSRWRAKRFIHGVVSVRERRGRLAADDRRRLVHKLVVFERLDHEQGEVDAAGDAALEDRVADVPAPHGQP
jgi:hypothetical protein